MADLQALLERVDAAAGPDRDLDGDIYWALERRSALRAYWNAAAGKPRELPPEFVPSGLGRQGIIAGSPKFTASVDACIALAERLLPGWRLRIQIEGDDTHEAWLENKGDFGAICAHDTESFCASPALALSGAILRAMLAKDA